MAGPMNTNSSCHVFSSFKVSNVAWFLLKCLFKLLVSSVSQKALVASYRYLSSFQSHWCPHLASLNNQSSRQGAKAGPPNSSSPLPYALRGAIGASLLCNTHTASTAAQVLSADSRGRRVREEAGPPSSQGKSTLHEVRLQTCMNLGVCKPRDPQGRKAGSPPKSSWVTFLRFAYLRMGGFRFARAMLLRQSLGSGFKVELQTLGSPRELHKGDNFLPHLQTSCLRVQSFL